MPKAIEHRRRLSPEKKTRRRWLCEPRNVAQSMTFEDQPVSVEMVEAEHARHPMPPFGSRPDETG